ncbi:MAG TPA: sigma-70 family RNA polymerase sigma factor [Chthoniobacterales bacterium]|jgi:RNA polymerase sigma-70 factor (ECF subfamily)|nr:sigma-70 family RNA polymerase sigma factor [Chthoniobacterales bacterium]
MTTPAADEKTRFELVVLPHLDAAYNLARWLTGNENDARDMVQEASLRAFKFFAGFRGGDARAWLLTIVRNTVYTWLERRRTGRHIFEEDDEIEKLEDVSVNPVRLLERNATIEVVRNAIAELVPEFREAVVLREMEGFSYKEIAAITGVRIGTVMSRLARGRRELQRILEKGATP